jgi:very-short-patch-repair endonuclease
MEPPPVDLTAVTPAPREQAQPGHVERRIAHLASTQHGVVTRRQLLVCGLTSSTIARWIDRGRLHRVHRGVFSVGHAALSSEARWIAGVLAVGDGAALGGRAGGLLWQISRFDTDVVTIVAPRHVRGLPELDVHSLRALRAQDMTVRSGIAALRVPLLLLSLTRDLTTWQLANVLHEAAFRRVLERDALDALIDDRRRHRGMAVLRRALEFHDAGSAGTMSALEDEFLRIIIAARLPVPEVNVIVPTPGGRYRVDFLWRRRRLCIETDGRASHERTATALDDELRDEHLRSAGQRVERFTARAVFHEPFAVARRLERLLA